MILSYLTGMPAWTDRVLGHEIAGRIEIFGSDVNCDELGLSVGDHVLVYPWIGCGNCKVCLAGMGNSCELDVGNASSIGFGENIGGFATHVVVPKCSYLIKIPDSLPSSVACTLPCAGLTAYNAVLKAKQYIDLAIHKFGEAKLLVLGPGGCGLWAIRLAKAYYKDKNVKIIAANTSKCHLHVAKEAGADKVVYWDINGGKDILVNDIKENDENKMDIIIDFIGSATTTQMSLQSLHRDGCLILIGLAGGGIKTPVANLVFSSATIQGSWAGSQQMLKDLVHFVAENEINYPDLEIFCLDEINLAIDELRDRKICGRAVLWIRM